MAVRWLAHAVSLDARVAAYHFDLARAYALLMLVGTIIVIGWLMLVR